MNKTVKYLLPATIIDMGGFPVKQAFPTQKVNQVDPFLLLHHAQTTYSPLSPAKYQGIGPHPHRGFSPVTFIIEGEIHHRDSRGHSQIAKAGEVQWMHAGAGIVHSERPTEAMIKRNEQQEIIQLWINSPASKKMIPPSYYYLSKANIPVFSSADGLIENKLIAGQYKQQKGQINTQSELLIIWGIAQAGGEQTLDIPSNHNAMIYLIKGSMRLHGYGMIETEYLAVLNNEGSQIVASFSKDTQFLLLTGLPINEKVTQSGPFVMNTQTQILEAIRDYQMGKMGVLIEDF